MLYVLRSGCPWRLLPHDFPKWQTVYWSFRRWQHEGVWDRILQGLRQDLRESSGRDREPSSGVIDSQSIKTSAVRGPEKGADGGKNIWGRKRHILVDTQGHLLAVKVTAANCSDLQGAKALLAPLSALLPRMGHLRGDSHYGGSLIDWVRDHLGWKVEPVRPPKPPSLEHLSPDQIIKRWQQVFPPPSRLRSGRWVVERTFAWIVGFRRLARDHEGLPTTSEAFIPLAMSRLMLSRLVPLFP